VRSTDYTYSHKVDRLMSVIPVSLFYAHQRQTGYAAIPAATTNLSCPRVDIRSITQPPSCMMQWSTWHNNETLETFPSVWTETLPAGPIGNGLRHFRSSLWNSRAWLVYNVHRQPNPGHLPDGTVAGRAHRPSGNRRLKKSPPSPSPSLQNSMDL